mgnify:CR=1 FL=1
MQLFLHEPNQASNLNNLYKKAFAEAEELFLVSAYLTEWDTGLALNPNCVNFYVIIGIDFGITRRKACSKLLNWLPDKWKANFLVADSISGFHPKAMFWKDKHGETYALVGSSNLTRAAFESNYEANFCGKISETLYQNATEWCHKIVGNTTPVDDGWISQYNEAPERNAGGRKSSIDSGLHNLPLPTIANNAKILKKRREQMRKAKAKIKGLQKLFRRCMTRQINSDKFYEQLPQNWGDTIGNRLQGKGFEIKGKHSDFRRLSESFIRILEASPSKRDNVVRIEIDGLAHDKIPTRGAFLSEMLCQSFPKIYPLLNQPVFEFLRENGFKAPKGASEGAKYIYLARTLRRSLIQNTNYAAKDLAELDAVIWHSVHPDEIL